MKPALIVLGITAALAATAAQAQSIDRLLERNAAEQSRIAADVARERIDAHNAALLEHRASDVYRLEAQQLAASNPDAARVRQAENDLAGAITWAEKHQARYPGTALDRMHLRVAATRDAEQQRWIANEFRQDKLTPAQASALETEQSRIAQAEYGAARKGHETVAAAESVQHMQDLQDYAIRKDPSLALSDAMHA